MFDYPLPLPKNTLYQELGVDPEAMSEEIREAKTDAVVRLDEERVLLEKGIIAAEASVPGLAECSQVLKAAQAAAEAGGTPPKELAECRRRHAEFETQAERTHPDLREKRKRLTEIERRKIEINNILLENPEQRQTYDREHPPLGLLALADVASDGFVDNRTAIHLVRREASAFLAAQAEEIFHPSDLYREDFRGDFTRHPLLDATKP